MYLQHFGLAQYPFSLTPNTHFFLKLPSHVEAFDQLIAALENQGGFIKITGEVGTGKTMLCRKVLNALENHRSRYVSAYIPHPILSEEAMLHALAEELSMDYRSDASYYEMLKLVSEQLLKLSNENKFVVLFIDEAQAMPEETLEAIRLLCNNIGKDKKLLQVVLFGQPELDTLLQGPVLRQLNKQISFSYKLPALDRDGVEAYISHRLAKAGYNGSVMFSRASLDQLYQASGGIPRLINILAHKSLLAAYGKGQQLVDSKHVGDAILDTESANQKADNIFKRLMGR